jgi:hypothetical protein
MVKKCMESKCLVGYLLILQPCNNEEHKLQFYPPLSHFDHLVIKIQDHCDLGSRPF